MIKPPISLQDLRRKLYVTAKVEPSWRLTAPGPLAGNGGVGDGCTTPLDWLYDTLGLFDAYRVSYLPALLKARLAHEAR